MFSLVDFLIGNSDVVTRLDSINHFNFTVKEFNFKGDEVTFVFLPWRSKIKDAIKFNWFKQEGKVFIYEGHDAIVNPNPHKANKLCEEIFLDFKLRSKVFFDKEIKINIIGLSTGTLYASNITNRFYSHIKNCKLVVPGPKLGENIFCSVATKKYWPILCKQEGFLTPDDYDKVFKYNVDSHIGHLSNVEIYLGMADMFIPTKNGEKLIEKMKMQHKKYFLHKIWFGHVFTLLFYGLILRFRK